MRRAGNKRIVIAALAVAVLALGVVDREAPGAPRLRRPVSLGRAIRPARVALLVLENRSYGQVIGNQQAPYLNALARTGALATHYYAITHPSLPNYLALTTGGHANVPGDCSSCVNHWRTLVNQLDAAHISWRAYFEDLPNEETAPYSQWSPYNRHYNPFVYESDVTKPGLVESRLSGFSGLRGALKARKLPRFSWIAPNVLHDGHSAGIAGVDRFARGLVPQVLNALGPRGVLFITWDEGRDSDRAGARGKGGGHVALIAVGRDAAAGAKVTARANHYALLKTIEGAFHLHPLGHAASSSTPVLSGLLR